MKHPIVALVAWLAISGLMSWVTIDMIRSGKVYGGRGRTGKVYTRTEWPATFWFHVVVTAIVTLAFFAFGLRGLLSQLLT